ncbi:MAG: hypothetical protein IT160_09975 [Bryobacterales bacterium]|nr:hypothetical protein [Bryobacterales bacterium]
MPSVLPMALTRQQLRCQVNRAEMMLIEAKAREEGRSVANYVRSKLGLPDRNAGRPTLDQLESEQDQAWAILRSLGMDPTAYFPPDDAWMDAYR